MRLLFEPTRGAGIFDVVTGFDQVNPVVVFGEC